MSNDDHVHEDVEVDIVVAHVDVVNNNKRKKEYASKGKKAYALEDVNDNLNDINVHLNKKSNESITKKRGQLITQYYAHIKRVDFDETSILIAHLEAIRMLLGLSCSPIFIRYHMNVKNVFFNRYLNEEVC